MNSLQWYKSELSCLACGLYETYFQNWTYAGDHLPETVYECRACGDRQVITRTQSDGVLVSPKVTTYAVHYGTGIGG